MGNHNIYLGRKKYEKLDCSQRYTIANTFFDLDLGVKPKVTHNIAQYPLHDVTYAPAKFELAMWRCIYKKIHF